MTNQKINHTTNQPLNQPINKSTNQPSNKVVYIKQGCAVTLVGGSRLRHDLETGARLHNTRIQRSQVQSACKSFGSSSLCGDFYNSAGVVDLFRKECRTAELLKVLITKKFTNSLQQSVLIANMCGV